MEIDVVHTQRYRVGKAFYEIQYVPDFEKVKNREVREGVFSSTSFIFQGVKEVIKIVDLSTEEIVSEESTMGKVLLTQLDVCIGEAICMAKEHCHCFDSSVFSEKVATGQVGKGEVDA